MNIEELKLVLETINGVADGATDAVLWWIVLHYGGDLLVHLAWIAMLGCVAFGAFRLVANLSEWAKVGRQIAELGGAPHAHFGAMSREDRAAVNRVIVAAREVRK